MKTLLKPIFILILSGLFVFTLTAMSSTLPDTTIKTFQFNVDSASKNRAKFDFRVTEAGCIVGQIKTWSSSTGSGPTAQQLALILNESNKTGYYVRNDGSTSTGSPLWISYAVTAQEVSQVGTWSISVVNFTGYGTAAGTLQLETPPTFGPCEFQVALSRVKGQVELSWRHTGQFFRGSFLIERSSNGQTWNVVQTCTIRPSARTTAYTCTDSGLTSGQLYYYRACAVATGSRCGNINLTPTATVKVL